MADCYIHGKGAGSVCPCVPLYETEMEYLKAYNAELKRELEESARLHGMGSDREARLEAKLVELERENAEMARTLLAWEYVSNGWPLSGEDFDQRWNLTQRGRSVIGDRDV